MAVFAELSESSILEEKSAENIKKATKVTLNIFRGYLQEKGLREADRAIDIHRYTLFYFQRQEQGANDQPYTICDLVIADEAKFNVVYKFATIRILMMSVISGHDRDL